MGLLPARLVHDLFLRYAHVDSSALEKAGGDAVVRSRGREQMQMLGNRNFLSPTYLNELGHIESNFECALGTGFSKDLPLLHFVVAEYTRTPKWLKLHHRQAASVINGSVVPLPGEHYLHHTHTGEIADGVREWEAGRTGAGQRRCCRSHARGRAGPPDGSWKRV
ncbi:hypothetical protein [Arthrobacter sp. TS-15]|uniref:hypothetical protein n=1 Tax=Arthrobacter sp. TS-15 TaxID=2510797 RepID=UPI001EE87ECD|nr:hypothetical protein [Arthrobacter sp. TS-15]